MRSLVDLRVDTITFLTAVVRASLGSHVGKPILLTDGQVVFPGFSGFRPPLMNDRLGISEIFLKGHKTQIKKKCNII